jgi:hypothetical protein
MIYCRETISKLSEECYNEPDINKKIQLLYKINSILPRLYQLNIPSLVTDDYVDTAQSYRKGLTLIFQSYKLFCGI